MWMYIVAGYLLTGVASQHLMCEYYYDNHEIQPVNERVCSDSEIDENGSCNTTQRCETGKDLPGNRINCFVSWKNESGRIQVLRKGCWTQTKPCTQRCDALLKKSILFCCCDQDYCNSQFFMHPNIKEPEDTEVPGLVIKLSSDENQIWTVLAYTLVPITLLSVLVVFIYWCYRKRKHTYSNIEIASVQTPGSALNATAQHPNFMMQPEIKLPQLIDIKARGRFGCVWKAQLQDKFVAVKVFYVQDRQSWLNEQEVFNTELVHYHPNILNFIAAASRGVAVEAELWLITEFHELGSLADYLKTNTMSLPVALKFMETMATGLSFLHEDIPHREPHKGYKPAIAHRDFKSKNVLIRTDMTAVIADFGLAVKFVPGECAGENHGQVGTRRYMAPEILEGAINFQRDAFLRIDMYAFALVMWEIITRCSDSPGGATPTYLMPYELELGQHPTLDEMQALVIDQKSRPVVKDSWRQHEVIGILCETMEDCWDHDAEARLSAGCVEERINHLHRRVLAPNELPMHPNMLNMDIIHNGSPLIGNGVIIPTNDTDLQNQINNQKNQEIPTAQEKVTNETSNTPAVVVACDAETALLTAGDRESNV